MKTGKKSRRQELADFYGSGRLRQMAEMHSSSLSHEAIDLLVDVVGRYCEPRRKKRFRGSK